MTEDYDAEMLHTSKTLHTSEYRYICTENSSSFVIIVRVHK